MRRTVQVRGTTNLALAVDVRHRVTVVVDTADSAIRPNAVVQLRSPAGTVPVTAGRPQWLLAERATLRGSRLVPQDIRYTVQSAAAGGVPLRVRVQQLDPLPESQFAVHAV